MKNKTSRLIKGITERNQKLLFVLKCSLVFYLLIFSMNYLVSNTSAHFSNSHKTDVVLKAGTWNVELEFPTKGNQNIKQCPAVIHVMIKNSGEADMAGPSKFEVYYVETGNPEKGEKAGGGEIPAMPAGKVVELIYETDIPGFYVLAAPKNPNSAGSEKIWSEKIKVDCKNKVKAEPKPQEGPADEEPNHETNTVNEPAAIEDEKQTENTPSDEQRNENGDTYHSTESEEDENSKEDGTVKPDDHSNPSEDNGGHDENEAGDNT